MILNNPKNHQLCCIRISSPQITIRTIIALNNYITESVTSGLTVVQPMEIY